MSTHRSKLTHFVAVLLSVVALTLSLRAVAQDHPPTALFSAGSLQAEGPRPARKAAAAPALLRQQLRFEPTGDGRMVSRSAGRILQVGKGGAIGLSASGQAPVAMYLAGANQDAAPTGEGQLPSHSNYFLGNDPAKYRTNVNQYSRARLTDVYPNIDLVYYGVEDRLEYDYIVAPHADPAQIRMRFEGAQPELDAKTGSLMLNTADHRTLELREPVAYQQTAGGARAEVAVSFHALADHQVAFSLAPYDHALPLVIDPIITYSTYFGGSNLDGIVDMRVDTSGNMYVLMQTDSVDLPQLGEPVTDCAGTCGTKNPDGPYATNPGSKYDFYVAALDSTGATLKFATYIGGSDRDVATSLVYDPSGYLYIAGGSLSTDFPTNNAYSTQPPKNGSGTITLGGTLTKITADGQHLLYSTFFGGGPLSLGAAVQDTGTISLPNADGLALSTNGVVYMIGYAGGTLTTKNPLFKEGNDFLAKFDTNQSGAASLLFATRVGDDTNGATGISLSSIAVDSNYNLWLYGETTSNTFPTTNSSSLQPTCAVANCNTSFLLQLNADSTAVLYGTFLGGSVNSSGAPAGNLPQDLVLDASNNMYVTGITNQVDYPLKNQAFGYSDLSAYGTTLGYITKVTAGGTGIAYSTLFSGQTNTIAVTASGQAAVAISTGAGYPTKSGLSTTTPTGANRDAVFLTFDTTASGSASLLVASYLGSSKGSTTPVRVVYDTNNLLYVSGYTTASDLPTAHSYQVACNSCSGANIAPEGFLTRLQPAAVFGASPSSVNFPDIPVGQQSEPVTVTISNPNGVGLYLTTPTLTDTKDFTFTNNCGEFVMPGGSCTILFTFTPQTSGALTATFTIANLDNQQSTSVIALSGTGTAGSGNSVTLTPTTLAFGSLAVGTTATMNLTLQNSGTSTLPIQSATVTGTGFSISTNGCGQTIAAGAICQYSITVAPTATGALTGTFSVVVGTPNVTVVHALTVSSLSSQLTATATGSSAVETLSPATVNFGIGYSGTVTTQVVTFTNSGSAPVTISGTTLTPTIVFSTVSTTCPQKVAAGASCTYTLGFVPFGAGAVQGTFTVMDGSSNPSAALTATGLLSQGNVILSPTSLTFANQVSGQPAPAQTLTVQNSFTASIQVLTSDITVQNTNGAKFLVIPNPTACTPSVGCSYSSTAAAYTILSGGSLPLTAIMQDNGTVDQTLMGTASVYWTLSSDTSPTPVRHPLASTLTGNLISPATPSVTPTTIQFPVTANGTTSAVQVVTVSNSGDQALIFRGVTFAGTNPTAFTQTNNCPASLIKAQCTINVVFAPGATGQSFTATMNVSLTAPSGDASVPVSLTGFTTNTVSDFTITSNSGDLGLQQFSEYVFEITPTGPTGAFNSPITFSVTGLPSQASPYVFSPSSVTPGNAIATVNLIFTPVTSDSRIRGLSRRGKGIGDRGLPVLAVGLFSVLFFRKRLRVYPRLLSVILFTLLTVGALSATGCGDTADATFVVTATSGSISHSVQLTGFLSN